MILDPHKIQEKMLTIISQYGIRLYKLRVTEAEIKILIRSVSAVCKLGLFGRGTPLINSCLPSRVGAVCKLGFGW